MNYTVGLEIQCDWIYPLFDDGELVSVSVTKSFA